MSVCHLRHECPSDHATYTWRGLRCVKPSSPRRTGAARGRGPRVERVAETARALGVSEQTVRRLVRDGSLHAIHVRGQVRLDGREVRAYLAAAGADGGEN
jgi:excisionase family DNA binding protein